MMLARFRSIGWVAAAAIAVLCCYLISLRVATERAALESLEAQISVTQKHIRVLQTELGSRGQMAQLERWNDQALALTAPEAEQFLPDPQALVALTEQHPAMPMQDETQLASAQPATNVMPATIEKVARDEPALRTVSYQPLSTVRLERVAPKPDKPVAKPEMSKPVKSIIKAEKAAAKPEKLATKKAPKAEAKSEKLAAKATKPAAKSPAKAEKQAVKTAAKPAKPGADKVDAGKKDKAPVKLAKAERPKAKPLESIALRLKEMETRHP